MDGRLVIKGTRTKSRTQVEGHRVQRILRLSCKPQKNPLKTFTLRNIDSAILRDEGLEYA